MNPDDELDIRQYLTVMRRRFWVIALSVIACVIVAAVFSSLQPKIYSATAKLVLSAQQDIATGTGGALSDPNQLQNQMQTQIEVVKSPRVKQIADQLLGANTTKVENISATGVTNTRVLSITATSKDAGIAQSAANAYSSAYLTSGQQNAVDRVLSIGSSVDQKRQDLQGQIDAITAQLNARPTPANASALQRQRDSLNTQIDQLQRQYDNAQASALVREASAQPLSQANLPASPTSPKPARNILMALFIGALIGVVLALVADRLDDRIRTKDQLAQWFPRLPEMGTVPRVGGWTDKGKPRVISLLEPQSPAAEAYRGVRTSLDFLAIEKPLKVLEITSSSAGEGKSTTVANLATILALGGKRVIVVDADMRRPRVHEFFRLTNEVGMTSVLMGQKPLGEGLQEVDLGEQTVQVLPTGALPPNPAELLASPMAADVFSALRQRADYVLIDSPPILPVADPLVLSKYSDGILLVAGVATIRKRDLDVALERMSHSTTPILGVLLNGTKHEVSYASEYGYYAKQGSRRRSKA